LIITEFSKDVTMVVVPRSHQSFVGDGMTDYLSSVVQFRGCLTPISIG
jgi:hypothetical protein